MSTVRARATSLLGEPTSLACLSPTISEVDSVVTWTRDVRGGVVLAIPHRRLNDVPNVARLFVYATGWDPQHGLSGYGATCE